MTTEIAEIRGRYERVLAMIEEGVAKEVVVKTLDFRMLVEDVQWMLTVAAHE